MISLEQARTHAAECGVDLRCYDALPIEQCKGRELASSILHPVDCSVLLAKDHFVSASTIRRAVGYGIDYATVYPV